MKKLIFSVGMIACLLFGLLLAGCTDPEQPPAYVTGGEISVSGGKISGYCTDDGEVAVYKGIPYAAAPVGELRWKAPQAVEPWEGVLDCTLWGANALQNDASEFSYWTKEYIQDTDPTHYRDGIVYSEDCLNLNVWSSTDKYKNKPVLVFIHGGGYNSGGASCEVYGGQNVAREDVVFVSIHYRVGVLGYLATEALAAEEEQGAGNYGLLDQIAALRWVQENIRTFGGDPGNVTVMGQSAGAGSVNALISSPLAEGLFVNAVSASHNSINRDWQTLDERIAQAPADLKDLTAEELRALPASSLKGRTLSTGGHCVDGYALTGTYRETLLSGKANDVNLMTGMVAYDNLLSSVYSNASKGITVGDSMIVLQNYVVQARRLGDYYGNAYVYFFDYNVPGNTPDTTGPYHTYDIPYFFGVFSAERAEKWTQADRDLSRFMMGALVSFCAQGAPQTDPAWEASKGEYEYMNFNTACSVKRLDAEKAAIVEEYYQLL